MKKLLFFFFFLVLLAPGVSARTVVLRPEAAGIRTELDTFGCPANWDCVNDIVKDDFNSYVLCDAGLGAGVVTEKDFYEINNTPAYLHTSNNTVITNMTVYFATKRDFSGNATPSIYTYGIEFNGSLRNLTDNWLTTYNESWVTNPHTATAWTWDEIDDLQIGINMSAHGQPAVSDITDTTQMYVIVDYDLLLGVASPTNDSYYNNNTIDLQFDTDVIPYYMWYDLNDRSNIEVSHTPAAISNLTANCSNDTGDVAFFTVIFPSESIGQRFQARSSFIDKIIINMSRRSIGDQPLYINITTGECNGTDVFSRVVPSNEIPYSAGGAFNAEWIEIDINATVELGEWYYMMFSAEGYGSYTFTADNGAADNTCINNSNVYEISSGSCESNTSADLNMIIYENLNNYSNTTIEADVGFNELTVHMLGSAHNASVNFTTDYLCNSTFENDTICGGPNSNYMLTCRKLGYNVYQWGTENMTLCHYGCRSGLCVEIEEECDDTCRVNDTMCMRDHVINCNQDTDGCWAWNSSNSTHCSLGCMNGYCVPCLSTCTANQSTCQGNYVVYCEDDNQDGCYEWSVHNRTFCELRCILNRTGQNASCSYSDLDVVHQVYGMFTNVGRDVSVVFTDPGTTPPTSETSLFFLALSVVCMIGLTIKTGMVRMGIIAAYAVMVMGSMVGWLPWFITILFIILGSLVVIRGFGNEVE